MSGLDSETKPSRRLWMLAALAALALHVGGAALAVAHLRVDETDHALGAPAIEIGLEISSPHLEATDLPPGPDTDATFASPALAEQKAELRETELPKDVPTETDDPDRVVTPSNKPREDDEKVAAVQTTASTESVAQVATAMPNLESRLNDKTTAPKQGIGKSAQLAKVTWEKSLMAHLKKHLQFPEGAKAKGAKVLLNVEFDRLGHVILATIAEGSGRPAFDEAALKMVRRSDPVPVPPPLVADQGLRRTLPVLFNDSH